jgi:hypothetical protein
MREEAMVLRKPMLIQMTGKALAGGLLKGTEAKKEERES